MLTVSHQQVIHRNNHKQTLRHTRFRPSHRANWLSKWFSTVHHIQVAEKTHDYRLLSCLAFIDYENGFASVDTAAVLHAIRQQGVEELYCRSLRDIFTDGTATIRLHTGAIKVTINRGVRQGDTISPKLFTARLGGLKKKLK